VRFFFFFDSLLIYIQFVCYMLWGIDKGILRKILKNAIFTWTFKSPLEIGTCTHGIYNFFSSPTYAAYLVNICPVDLERQLLTVDDKRRSMARGYMSSGMFLFLEKILLRIRITQQSTNQRETRMIWLHFLPEMIFFSRLINKLSMGQHLLGPCMVGFWWNLLVILGT
jgi:hypothetical protein